MGGIGESHTVTERAQVKAIEPGTREVALVGPQGNVFVVHAGDAVRNLDKVKVGDTVVATYYSSTVLVLSAAGSIIPDNRVNAAAARAARGELPAAAVSTESGRDRHSGRGRSQRQYHLTRGSVGGGGAYLCRYRATAACGTEAREDR